MRWKSLSRLLPIATPDCAVQAAYPFMGAVVVREHRRVLVGMIFHEGVKRITVRVPNHAGIDPVRLPILRANCESLANWPLAFGSLLFA